MGLDALYIRSRLWKFGGRAIVFGAMATLAAAGEEP